MNNFSSLVAHNGSKCLNEEWMEYIKMLQVRTDETPKNDLLPYNSKKYLETRKLIYVSRFHTRYAPVIGIAICFSCDQLIYTGQRTKNIGNYNNIKMERYWATHCTGNTFCGVSYDEYLKIKQKSISEYNFDIEYALHRYGLWMQKAIKKLERAREAGKIRACITIQREFIEFMYKPDGLKAIELAQHYKLLWAVREEMRQINNGIIIVTQNLNQFTVIFYPSKNVNRLSKNIKMSLYTGTANTSFSSVSNFSSFSSTKTSSSASATENILRDSTDAVPKRMSDCNYYRNLWWEKGEFNEKARWDEVTLPYVLATGIAIDEYEQRSEKFNIHGCWEWSNGEVLIYELPSMPHEVGISAIVKQINRQCGNADGTNAEIYGFGATRTRDRNRGKEADASFRPKKPAVTAPNGSDGNDLPWPNLVVEVAYTETLDHVEEALCYWLSLGRAHDCIIVKIDPVPQGQVPARMRAWHYCVSAGRGKRNIPPLVTEFEFGTQDGTGAQLNIVQGQCVINVSLRCLYHDLKPTVQMPQNLPDPIPLDFFFVQHAITEAFDIH
ncbi:hypothetical protein Glove_113g66 [Diversispora epigaea]|uniref:Restriction endonuclease domain-containing protein n=1 Tax=Diversispora epigaea TaxID=1348612 RepID=A0A397JB16_9GLOM|nr:hypothetical protein Glove_113g66 [Diversispora epigaea]